MPRQSLTVKMMHMQTIEIQLLGGDGALGHYAMNGVGKGHSETARVLP